MITSIIFSKDRPLQLDLCLNSIKKNFKDSTQNIVIHNNSESFRDTESTLKLEHENVEFWKQSGSLFKDVFHAIHGAQNNFVCFFTDDDIFYDKFECSSYDFLNDASLSCLSLRMGLNIVERFHQGQRGEDKCQKGWKIDNGMIVWSKTFHGFGSYWSYDLSVDGHIYRKSSALQMMDELCFLESRYGWGNTPNVLEEAMQRFWAIGPNFVVAPQHSVVVNSPNNRVQDTHQANASGEVHDYDSRLLLEKYQSGNRIDLSKIDFSNIKCPHTELDILRELK